MRRWGRTLVANGLDIGRELLKRPIMSLKYAVAPRTILLCDYSLNGFKSPEMVKR